MSIFGFLVERGLQHCATFRPAQSHAMCPPVWPVLSTLAALQASSRPPISVLSSLDRRTEAIFANTFVHVEYAGSALDNESVFSCAAGTAAQAKQLPARARACEMTYLVPGRRMLGSSTNNSPIGSRGHFTLFLCRPCGLFRLQGRARERKY